MASSRDVARRCVCCWQDALDSPLPSPTVDRSRAPALRHSLGGVSLLGQFLLLLACMKARRHCRASFRDAHRLSFATWTPAHGQPGSTFDSRLGNSVKLVPTRLLRARLQDPRSLSNRPPGPRRRVGGKTRPKSEGASFSQTAGAGLTRLGIGRTSMRPAPLDGKNPPRGHTSCRLHRCSPKRELWDPDSSHVLGDTLCAPGSYRRHRD